MIALFDQTELADPFNLQLHQLKPETIAHSLSQLNRYTGHALFPYSVAQHTVLLMECVPDFLKRAALMHDWSEAFTNDVARPVKLELPEYRQKEREIQERIYTLMGEPIHNLDAIHDFDYRICADEMRALFPHYRQQWIGVQGLGAKIEEWSWRQAKNLLLSEMRVWL